MNHIFEENGCTYKTENAIRITTTTIDDEYFGEVMGVILWRTEDGLYYFTLEDIVSDDDLTSIVHFWAAEPNAVRYWMHKNGINLDEIEDSRVAEDDDLYEAIIDDLYPNSH